MKSCSSWIRYSVILLTLTRPNCRDSSLQITRKRKRLMGRHPRNPTTQLESALTSITYRLTGRSEAIR